MCGIAGVINPSVEKGEQAHHLQQMLSCISHRGPDHTAVWQSNNDVSLGHCRLAILDLHERANQPMHDAGQRYTIVFNGEIYNMRSVRAELETLGHGFTTHSDTEVLLCAFIQWGEDCLHKLDGMYAFAIWDAISQSLFLARDRFGEKPLYYQQADGAFIFASELKAVQAHPSCSRALSRQALREYLELGYILTSSCIIDGVKKLPAAHFMWVRNGQVASIKRYWDCTDLARAPKADFTSMDAAADAMAEILTRSVKERQLADVPVGVFLSGGIDSTLIALAVKRWLGHEDIDSFSAGFQEKGYSEVDEARMTSRLLGTNHHDIFMDQSKLTDDLTQIVYHADEPFADTSMVPTFYLSRFVREHVKVSLSGDAGDELFAGYETYQADRLYSKTRWLPRGVFSAVDQMMAYVPAQHDKVGLYYKLRAFARGAQHRSAEEAHWSWRRVLGDHHIQELLGSDALSATVSSYQRISSLIDRTKDLSHLDRMQCIDIETWMCDDILVKLDRMSMAHSLEGRVPFLSKDMVAFAFSLPDEFRINKHSKKAVLRHQVAKSLSHDIAYRRKAGFNAPVSHWFKGLLNQRFEALMEEVDQFGLIDVGAARRMLLSHEKRKDDHGYRLFALYCLAEWLVRNKPCFK